MAFRSMSVPGLTLAAPSNTPHCLGKNVRFTSTQQPLSSAGTSGTVIPFPYRLTALTFTYILCKHIYTLMYIKKIFKCHNRPEFLFTKQHIKVNMWQLSDTWQLQGSVVILLRRAASDNLQSRILQGDWQYLLLSCNYRKNCHFCFSIQPSNRLKETGQYMHFKGKLVLKT